MSFFLLPTLRTKDDYDDYMNDVEIHQLDPEHLNHLGDDINKLTHIANIILKHFNNDDLEKVDPNNPNLELCISDISEENRNILQNTLLNKGYTVEYINDFQHMIISNE